MGAESPGGSSRTNFIRDFWIKSLIKIGPLCSINRTYSVLKGAPNVPKIAHRVFGTKSPLLDPPGDLAPIGPGDP